MLALDNKHLALPSTSRLLTWASALLCVLVLSACGGSGGAGSTTPTPQLTGKTAFVSADRGGSGGLLPEVVAFETRSANDAKVNGTSRTIVQGDIYRVLDAGRYLLNLNPTRGLQIIDLSDPASPAIVGRVAMSGSPVEMYSVGSRAYILMDNWSEYKPLIKDGQTVLDPYHGAVVVTVDISQRQAPKILETTRIGNFFVASRLSSMMVNGQNKSALYVAAQNYLANSPDVILKSFTITSEGRLQAVSSINLGGYARTLQTSGDYLMVAKYHYSNTTSYSEVSVIDIASPEGVMVQGGSVRVAGLVQQKNNMHIQDKMMRVVSGASWSNNASLNSNHVESFSIADIKKPIPIDHKQFGAGQQLFATHFMADRAFFVTYLRQDPFHAFSITADGLLKEENEFIVSGWNDFFVPAYDNTRLVGVGHNDENNRRSLAISLYDVTHLTNKQPLITRAELDLSHSWSEANWDDRAFTVLENATDVMAADGKTRETGLVLLPFTAWDAKSSAYQSGVQIFSFSANTVTKRGVMQQDSQVTRSVVSNTATALNLSNTELSLFGLSNLQTPNLKSRLELVANYSQFLSINNGASTVGVRYKVSDYSWWGSQSNAKREDTVELFTMGSGVNADTQTPLARLKVPEASKLYEVDGRLVVIATQYQNEANQTTVLVYDLSNPASPQLLSQFVSDKIMTTNFYTIMDKRICIWGRCGGLSTEVKVLGKNLIFVGQTNETLNSTATSLPRFSRTYAFQVLSLADPRKPVLQDTLKMNKEEEAVGLVKQDQQLWVSYKKAQGDTNGNGEMLAKYFIKPLTVGSAGQPSLGKEINVPGELMAVQGDQLFCLEYNWIAKVQEPSLHHLILQNDIAYLQATYDLKGQAPSKLALQGSQIYLGSYDELQGQYHVLVLQLNGKVFSQLARIMIGEYIDLNTALGNKLILNNGYGFLVYDLSNPKQPQPQAYFAANTWSSQSVFYNNQLFLAAGTYGIYQFGLDVKNL